MDQLEQSDLESAMEALEFEESEAMQEAEATEPENLLAEVDEMELAAEMLEVTSENELDSFIRKLLKEAARRVGGRLPAQALQVAGGILKGAIRKALPAIGSPLGSALRGASRSAGGRRLSPRAGAMLGLELEGLSPEDKEFEVARRLVRYGGATVGRLGRHRRWHRPRAAAKRAAVEAARYHAPGLLRASTTSAPEAGLESTDVGRWVRRGRNIIIVNC